MFSKYVIRDQHISWDHVRRIYKHRSSTGLTFLPRLTLEHLNPNSYSRMRVNLAAQVNIHVAMQMY